MIRALLLAALFVTVGCSETAPPLGQILLYVDTDAPVPSSATQATSETESNPLFDALRVDLYEPLAEEPCRLCSRTFTLDAGQLEKIDLSLGIRMRPGVSGYRVRLRLYPFGATVTGEVPQVHSDGTPPGSVIDVIASVPPIAEDGIVVRSVLLKTESTGLPIGTLDAPVPLNEGRPAKSLVGTWPGARRVPCAGDPVDDEVCVPGGAFWMGNTRATSTVPFNAVDRLRLVVLSPFWVEPTEVTVGRYRAAQKRPEEVWSGNTTGDEYNDFCTFTDTPGKNENLPLNCVSWNKARAFCQARGADLPTEAQFEFVAGAFRSQLYVWGNDRPDPPPGGCSWAVLERGGWGQIAETYPQQCKPAMPPGGPLAIGSTLDPPRRDRVVTSSGEIFDLVGNVEEMCLDAYNRQDEPCWSAGGVYVDPVCTEGIFDGKPSKAKVLRGGWWGLPAENATAASRDYTSDPSKVDITSGFRCFRSAQ